MISFPTPRRGGCVVLARLDGSTNQTDNSTYCALQSPPPTVYNATVLIVELFMQNRTECENLAGSELSTAYYSCFSEYLEDNVARTLGFRVSYSFHSVERTPTQLASGRWDCSGPAWPHFQHHLHCNLLTECHGAEDEAGCEFTTARCGPGAFLADDMCYFVTKIPADVNDNFWTQAGNLCMRRGGQLASVTTKGRYNTFKSLVDKAPFNIYLLGLSSTSSSLPIWQVV
jgi:hypothetical protein